MFEIVIVFDVFAVKEIVTGKKKEFQKLCGKKIDFDMEISQQAKRKFGCQFHGKIVPYETLLNIR